MSGRLLTRSGDTQTVGYNLYTSSAYTTAWGDGSGSSSTVAGTGTGLAQSTTVFGRLPAQTTPQAGTYTDTIIVTVTY
ncbi:spore coat protein U domain-containing protein [Ralstonia solanacearum species complex bacterium KE056]|uniref:spore coat protein U domain-containing protein n=1 Tax=Ralstonia solanacearum species complex bacterium KE056 TaxID=3119585 RepID=UPI002FC2A52B